jgi:predicted DNA-binding protein (MmcQ/YjbR family)
MAHPRMYDDSSPALKRLRELCLALPATFEKEAWGECTFRVTGGSMFAMTDSNHHGSNHTAVWVKATPMVQEILVNADGKRFFVPPYVGPKGWVGVRLDYKVDWDELGGILEDGHRMSAPKRLRASLPPGNGEAGGPPTSSERSPKTRQRLKAKISKGASHKTRKRAR